MWQDAILHKSGFYEYPLDDPNCSWERVFNNAYNTINKDFLLAEKKHTGSQLARFVTERNDEHKYFAFICEVGDDFKREFPGRNNYWLAVPSLRYNKHGQSIEDLKNDFYIDLKDILSINKRWFLGEI